MTSRSAPPAHPSRPSSTLDTTTAYGRIDNALKNTDGVTAKLATRTTTKHGTITARSL
ncbi:hypothetical protein ACW4TU_01340 [Streptomyces sp. QTS52]